MDKKKLAVCAVFENEAPYLPEFLAYHHLVGVEHFVLYDNGSTDDPARAIRGTKLAEHVTLIGWPQQPAHLAAYRHFIDIFAPGFEWVAFIDVGEFLLPLHSRNVVDTLDWLSSASAVLVHGRVFGPGASQGPPSGLVPEGLVPSGLVIENYGLRAADDFPANRQVKTIARCSQLLDATQNLNEFRINGPVFNTAGHLAPNRAMQAQPCYQNLVLNRYYTRSRTDWLEQLQHGEASADTATPLDEPGMFDHLTAVCQVPDSTIQAFAGAVRELLDLGSASAPPPETISRGPAAPTSPMGVASPAMPVSPSASAAVPASVAVAVQAALDQHAAGSSGARPDPASQPDAAVSSRPVQAGSAWAWRGQDAQERAGGLGLVFRDRSRQGEHWFAALRGAAVAAIDPAFLLDEYDRIREFPTDTEARAACDAALAEAPRH